MRDDNSLDILESLRIEFEFERFYVREILLVLTDFRILKK